MEDEWTVPQAASAIKVSLVPPPSFPSSKSTTHTFHPKFTHQFFENEAIYGYKNLAVDINFRQDDMSPSLDVSYDAKLSNVGGSSGAADQVTVDEVEDRLREYLPEDTPQSLSLSPHPTPFTPPGTLIHTYPRTTSTFQIYHTNLSSPGALSLIKNSQLLVPFFIEAGSAIDLSDDEEYLRDRWDVFFLYELLKPDNENDPDQFSFVGYCTVHKYWYFSLTGKDSKDFPHEYRARISQFLILPPYQGKEHGQKLYNVIIKEYLSSNQVKEIVVEDPSEDFERLRDLSDFKRLKKQSLITDEAVVKRLLDRKTAREWIDTERAKAKMPMRQFQRMVELLLLEYLLINRKAPDHEDQLARYMLYVKERLYRHNKDILMQLEREERSEKLHETYERVHSDYELLLSKLGSEAVVDQQPRKRVIAGKRPAGKISTVEEEGEEEEELEPPSKKLKAKN